MKEVENDIRSTDSRSEVLGASRQPALGLESISPLFPVEGIGSHAAQSGYVLEKVAYLEKSVKVHSFVHCKASRLRRTEERCESSRHRATHVIKPLVGFVRSSCKVR